MIHPRPPARRRLAAAALLAVCLGLLLLLAGPARGATGGAVGLTEVRGPITPVVADHLTAAVDRAEREDMAALVVELDTPGGLITAMRQIVQSFLGADVPVVVYVSPRGADAGSAGTFVTLAAHVAAMAPATTIGAATPVDVQGGEVGDKIVNNAAAYAEAIATERNRSVDFAVAAVREGRSITADEAVRIGAVDVVAPDLDTLLATIDGRTVQLVSGPQTLQTAGVEVVAVEWTWFRRLLQWLADPEVALLLISVGTLGLIYELAQPGLGAGAVVGGIALVLGLAGLSALPLNAAGVALVLLGIGLFIAELFIPGIGVGAVGGTIALIVGGLLLFPRASGIAVDLVVLLPATITVAVLVGAAAVIVARTRGRPSHANADALVGRTAAVQPGPYGPRVRLDGTYWRARPAPGVDDLPEGRRVEVVDRDNLDLVVRPTTDAPPPAPTDDDGPAAPLTSDRSGQ